MNAIQLFNQSEIEIDQGSMLVSVVVNTYNRIKELQKLIYALQWQRYENFEVIVVNGPSTDGTNNYLELASKKFPIKIQDIDEANLSKSRNVGISVASGDIVAFIDDDAIPEPDWLSAIVNKFIDPKIGAVGGLIRDNTGESYQCRVTVCDLWGDAKSYSTESEAFRIGKAHNSPDTTHYLSPTGANSAFRKSALLSVDGFDEHYNYFLDETDVTLRLIKAGWKVAYALGSEVHHKFAPSHIRGNRNIPKTTYESTKSKIYFFNTHAKHIFGSEKANTYEKNFIADRLKDYKRYLFEGLIDTETHNRLSKELHRGVEVGRNLRRNKNEVDLNRQDGLGFHTFPTILPTQNRIRICFASQEYSPNPVGGIGRWTETMATALARRGHEVSVITKSNSTTRIDFENGVWIHRIERKHHNLKISEFEDLPTTISDWCIDVKNEALRIKLLRGIDILSAPIWDVEGAGVFASGLITTITSLHTTYKLALPTKRHWNNDIIFRKNHVDKIIEAEKKLLEKSEVLLANSYAILRDIETAYNIEFEKFRSIVVPHGVDIQLGNRREKPTDIINVLFVGRFEKRKGIDTLVPALQHVMMKYRNVHVTLIGGYGPYEDELGSKFKVALDQLVETYSDRMRVRGYVSDSDLQDEYSSADIFVAPSRYESFGLIFAEAMMHKLPCIGCNVGGIPEVIMDDDTGILVPPGNVEALKEALIRLIENPETRASMGSKGYEKFLSEFSSDNAARKFEAALLKVLKSKKGEAIDAT